jgi:hypothetical protein
MIIVLILVFIIIRVLFLSTIFPFVVLVPEQVTSDNSEGSYSDSCRRQHIRWSLV